MKTIIKIVLICSIHAWHNDAFSQSKTAKEVNNKINVVNNATRETGSTIDNAVQTLDNAKKLFKGLAGNVATSKNRMTIVVAGISFNNPKLTALEEAIKKIRGTKNVSKSLQSGTITITLKYRNDANSLWNKLPNEIKKMYKPVEVVDKNLLLDF